jgi:phosphoglycolate phosphatase
MSACVSDFPFDTVVFDLDGTLADTVPDIAAALNRALTRLDRPALGESAVRAMVGNGARALVRAALAAAGAADAELEQAAHAYFLHFYAERVCAGTRPYPGAGEALDGLAAAGARLAICTNKPEALSRALLAALGWEERFAAVVGGDSLSVRKPDPAPLIHAVACAGGGRAAFVGDSAVDADTARAAGLPFVAVGHGYRDRPLAALGADAAIDGLAALVPALRALGSARNSPAAGTLHLHNDEDRSEGRRGRRGE